MIAKPLKRLARWIWTAQVALEYSAQLAHHGWTWQQCKDHAERGSVRRTFMLDGLT